MWHEGYDYEDIEFEFQYRKRYEITCDLRGLARRKKWSSFNTASGMRSHVTNHMLQVKKQLDGFQYRKRYEITCDAKDVKWKSRFVWLFQYRKRYEITCDCAEESTRVKNIIKFQYRKRYEITCDICHRLMHSFILQKVSIPQAVWDHMWHYHTARIWRMLVEVSIPQAVWDHMWHDNYWKRKNGI